jgi:hypothetical protein
MTLHFSNGLVGRGIFFLHLQQRSFNAVFIWHKSGSCPGRATDFDHIKQCKPVPIVNSGTVSETSGVMISCNRSPGSKLLSITMQLHCVGHLGGIARLPNTILEKDPPMTIPSKLGSNWATGSRQDGFYVNFP